MKRTHDEKELIIRSGGSLLGWIFGQPSIVINSHGVSCVKWPFTIIPWNKVKKVAFGSLPIKSLSEPTMVLEIYLKSPGEFETATFDVAAPSRSLFPKFRREDMTKQRDGSSKQPTILSFDGLNKSALQALNHIYRLNPDLIGYEIEGLIPF